MKSVGKTTFWMDVSLLPIYSHSLTPCLTSMAAGTLNPKQRLLCTPVVRGYCLAFKTWGKSSRKQYSCLFAKMAISSKAEFYVENVYPIRWSENAFPRLVLPPGYKDIIRAFVQEQLSRDDEFDDIVYGKGETHGLVDVSQTKRKLLTPHGQVWDSSCCSAEIPVLGKHSQRNLVRLSKPDTGLILSS